MEIKEAKKKLEVCEKLLEKENLVEFAFLDTGNQKLQLYLSSLLKKNCSKKRIWKSKAFFITLKNIKYGIDLFNFKSKGGRDGIFVIDRSYTPKNMMQKKIFDQFIDNENSDFNQIVNRMNFSSDDINAVRIVSHHMRLLGIHQRIDGIDKIVLVDFDDTK
jgi:hypothetical protein